jgi:hypothetical protein
MIIPQLDQAVARGRVTGYTIEEDTGYLDARLPTLTYRMYADGPESHRNLGEFAAAMAGLDARMRLSRVHGTVAEAGVLRRSRQLCLTAEFDGDRELGRAVELVERRFTYAPAAAPGSWRFPDVRIAGGAPSDTAAVYAHRWQGGKACAVVLTLDAEAPAAGGVTSRVRVLQSWVGFLRRQPVESAYERRSLAWSIQ